MKLLDYGRINPWGPVAGNPINIAWPVNGYRITLPQVQKRNNLVNPFETLILNFIDADCQMTEAMLAEETCLSQNLIHGIILRLQENGYLDEHGQIVAEKKSEWLGELSIASENYVTAMIFQELITGTILPFVHFIQTGSPLKFIADDDRRSKNKKLSFDHQKTYPVPTPQDVLQVLYKMRTRAALRGEVCQIPSISRIKIIPQPENYYLFCPMAIQKRDGEFRIADPFGNGFSMPLENIFSELLGKDEKLAQWYKDWLSDVGRSVPRDEGEAHYSFDTPELRNKYPKLIPNLRPARGRSYRSIKDIYASIEWTLFYFCCKFSCNDAVRELSLSNEENMVRRLVEFSGKLGFSSQKLRYVKPGRLIDFQNGKAELTTLIGIFLTLTDTTGAQIFGLRLAKRIPDLFEQLYELKNEHDEIGHGAKTQFDDVKLRADDLLKDILAVLLPDVFLDGDEKQVNHDAAFDLMIEARIRILSFFPFESFNRMGNALQSRLISAEKYLLLSENAEQSCNVGPLADDFYSAVQIAFRPHLYTNLPPNIDDDDLKKIAAKKMNDAGFAVFPEHFNHVNIAKIKASLYGRDQTLGAAALAFILVSAPERLASIVMHQPSFFVDVAEIANLRGHNNEIIAKTYSELIKLKISTYKTIQTLMEV